MLTSTKHSKYVLYFFLGPIIIALVLFLIKTVLEKDSKKAEVFNEIQLKWIKNDLAEVKRKYVNQLEQKSLDISKELNLNLDEKIKVYVNPDDIPLELKNRLNPDDFPRVTGSDITVVVKIINNYDSSISYWKIESSGNVMRINEAGTRE